MDEETGIEEAPVETTDQPIEEAQSPEVDAFELDPNETANMTPEQLQERAKSLQGDYTRKTQTLAEQRKEHEEAVKAFQEEQSFLEALRSDPDTQRAILEQLQEILAEESEDPEAEAADPRDERIAALEQAETQRQSVALATALKGHIEQLAGEAKLELDENDFQEIFQSATAGQEVNGDNTVKAFEAWSGRRKAIEERTLARYLDSKKAPQLLPDGTAATDTYDFNDVEERQRRLAAALEAK